MKSICTLIVCSAFLSGAALAETITFDDVKTGGPPPGWTATQTGSGSAKWSVEKDDSAPSKPNVLKQSGQATFPVCFKNDTNLKDGFVEVKFKPVAGKEDQAGGVIWRVQDSNNYYIARANALEDNVTIYHTIKGHRVAFKSINTKVSITDDTICSSICSLSPNECILVLVKVILEVEHTVQVIESVICLCFPQFPFMFEQAPITWSC